MKQSKKGYTAIIQKVIVYLFITLPFLVAASAMLYDIGESYEANTHRYPQSVEDQVIETRLLYNPDCFAYQRPSGRTELAVLDPSRLDRNSVMNDCLKQDPRNSNKKIPVKLTVTVNDKIQYAAHTDAWNNAPVQNPRIHTYVVHVKDKGLGKAKVRYT